MITLQATNTIQGVAGTGAAISYTIFGDELSGTTDTFKVLAQGQLAITAGVLYTVPASTTALVKSIKFANTTASDVTGVIIYINGTSATNIIKASFTFPAYHSLVLEGNGWSLYNASGALVTSGAAGDDGSIWRDGSGAPSNVLGVNGDYYLNTHATVGTGDVYLKSAGTYSIVGNIKGATGNTGNTGNTGAAATITVGSTSTSVPASSATVANSGTSSAAVFDFTIPAGSVWRSGTDVPANGTGVNGDYYLRTSNGDVYLRSAGTYSVVGNIKGTTGNTGTAATIAAGNTSTGVPGSSATVTNSGTSSAAIFDFTIPAGSVWRDGAGVPSNATGVNGDYYLRTSYGDVYLKSTGTYSVVGNIKGLQGDVGPAGSVSDGDKGDITVSASGATWTVDSAAISNSKLANMTTKTYKGRTAGTTGAPEDVSVATLKTDLALTSSDVGLGNVTDTSDDNKPVSTAQQNALDLKVDENAPITGATKTKITYDSKGLVTEGADMQESELVFTDITTNNASAIKHGFLPKLSGSASDVFKGDGSWGAEGGGSTLNSEAVAFTDGDTFKRVRITNASVDTTSKIVPSITRPNVTDEEDRGYMYNHNIVYVDTGYFDLLISCLSWGMDDATDVPPNETITVYYTIT